MKPGALFFAFFAFFALPVHAAPPNPAIDMQGYLLVSTEAAKHREARRVSEEDFIRLSREPGSSRRTPARRAKPTRLGR